MNKYIMYGVGKIVMGGAMLSGFLSFYPIGVA